MAESELSLQFADFQAEIGEYLGEGRSGWDTPMTNRIAAVINRGYAMALKPPPLQGKTKGHDWSYAEPTTSLTTTAGDYDQDLPDNFGAIIGPLTFASDTAGKSAVRVVSEGMIRQFRQGIVTSGQPVYAAVRPKGSFDGSAGQRSEIIFYPTPDAAYVLSFKMSLIVANRLDASNPYPIGGMSFSYLVLAACLAVAEKTYRDGETAKQQDFLVQLAAEISRDLQNAPEFLGYNGDRSAGGQCGPRYYGTFTTHNGNPIS